MRLLIVLLSASLGWSAPASAQDAHYWTYGYGPIGQLTEGTLVGGVNDLSATFYNPAACALMDEPRFVVTLNSIEIARIDVPGAAGEGLDFDQSIFDVVPAMVAGHVGSHDGGPNHFAVAFLARHDSDFDLGYSDVTVSSSASDGAAGFGRFRQRLVEYWVGGAWSRRVSDRTSVGVSSFVAYRGQRSRRSLTVEEVAEGQSRALFVGNEAEYNHVRLLAKLGFAWRPEPWELGATVTVPGLKLWSSGKALYNASVVGEVEEPILAASTQTSLSADYRPPWSVAVGATRRWTGTSVHFTAEWFSSVGEYLILRPEPAAVAGRAETIPLEYRGEARSVVNYGVGVEQRLSGSLVAFGGAARNHSSYVPERDAFSAWDLNDATAGVTLDVGSKRLAFGVGYAWGAGAIQQVVVPPEETMAPAREARFSRWTFSVGASFHRR